MGRRLYDKSLLVCLSFAMVRLGSVGVGAVPLNQEDHTMRAGNRSVLVVLDSRLRVQRMGSETTVFAALEHFGAACEVLDGGEIGRASCRERV